MLPLVITGVSGVAGFNALHWFTARYAGRVVGVRPPATWRLTGPGIVAADTADRAALERLFSEHQFQAVLNTTGNCALKSCELDPEMSRRTNVVSAANVAALARRFGCRLVHLSSDLVFSGADPLTLPSPPSEREEGRVRGRYRETDPVDPVTVYGKTMAEGEGVVRVIDPGAAVLRISLPMGPSFNRHAGAIDWIGSRFRKGRPATLYFDEVRSCAYTDDLNRVFDLFLRNDWSGLYHLGGPRPLTLYQIAQVVNRVGGYDPHLLKGCPRREAGPIPPRVGNVSMDSDKLLTRLGYNPFRPWPAGEELVPTDRQWHFRRPQGEPGSYQWLVERLYRYSSSEVVGW